MLSQIQSDLRQLIDPEKAKILPRFFKTGKGQYGEGDKFLGVTVPSIRSLVKKYHQVELEVVTKLIKSPWHEERMLGLLILVKKFESQKLEVKKIYDLYLSLTKYINNWDLVDLTAPNIVGEYLKFKNKREELKILTDLAQSKSLWERRIAMLATFAEIKKGQSDTALKIAHMLLRDTHDLMHKAVGWMLREVGKRCSEKTLTDFLDQYHAQMSRTTLRYAIERLSEKQRRYYLNLT